MKITKYVITSPESDILPSDIAMKIYGSKYDVNVKETCFGVIISGEEEVIKPLVEEIRALDPSGIFIKERGFPPGDRFPVRPSVFASPRFPCPGRADFPPGDLSVLSPARSTP